ncbi:hypothetical protein T4D_12123 [Trichinella pseudospiralis]|uniref:Uncharacterized protein n=1 Tax=Trichinella pseudospiralis TaxID=6337 RepID=A0A0V1F6I9_TRIPS|nr:hypothetical protein T4D_5386 [Trichinella pseudospiralis]KRY88388.1 hypothetical protein T4D_12123 [Trichinella pseudospiralis]
MEHACIPFCLQLKNDMNKPIIKERKTIVLIISDTFSRQPYQSVQQGREAKNCLRHGNIWFCVGKSVVALGITLHICLSDLIDTVTVYSYFAFYLVY